MEHSGHYSAEIGDLLHLNGKLIRRVHFDQDFRACYEEASPLEKEVLLFLKEWWGDSNTIALQTSGSTGQPKTLYASRSHMLKSAGMTIEAFNLQKGMHALLCLSPAFVAGKMMVVRAIAGGLKLITTNVRSNPLAQLEQKIDFAAMVPLQVRTVLEQQAEKLSLIRCLIIGGSAVSVALEEALQRVDTHVFHTYGMTETLSHVALRAINGPQKSDWFTPLAGVQCSTDERGCLTLQVDWLQLADLQTNDLVNIAENGQFTIEGRLDDVIITAGNKVHPAAVEKKLSSLLKGRFAISSEPHEKAGQAVVLVLEEAMQAKALFELWQQIEAICDAREMPRRIIAPHNIPWLESGKTDRVALRKQLHGEQH